MIDKHENAIFTGNLNPALISQIIINKYKLSPIIKEMRIADRYYDTHNEIIEKKRRVYFDKDRKPIENPNANNAKIKNNFLRMLVQQKQDYGFAKSFILKLSDENEQEIELTENDYGKEWKKFLDNKVVKKTKKADSQI